jgi:L-asparaginase
LVVMHDEIHAASEVKKTHTEHAGTFQSLDFGPLGIVEKTNVLFYRKVVYHSHVITDKIDTKVDLIKTCAGMDDRFLRFSADSGIHGIVLEGLGRGNVPPKVFEGVKYVIQEKGIPVVLVSRCPRGRVLDTYAYYGGGKQLRELGVIFGENLPGHKARIKLMLALGKTQNYEEIRKIFEGDRYARYGF